MKRSIVIVLLIIVQSFTFSSCEFISRAGTYTETTSIFVDNVLEENYDDALTYFALENEAYSHVNLDSFKISLSQFRNTILDNFGNDLTYSLMMANKTYSTSPGMSTAPNTTETQIQFSNDKEFGVFKIIFDDQSNKILHFETLDIRAAIPNTYFFWLFGIIPLSILIFNIWMIIKIKKSELKRKWLKYLAVLFLNIPSISYSAMSGFSFHLLNLHLLGLGVSAMGYLNYEWALGIPLGGIYWLWKLKGMKHDQLNENLDLETTDIIESQSNIRNS